MERDVAVFCHQKWSLPDSVIYNITKYPSSTKFYKKIIQTCKYFYAKNPITITMSLILASDYKWKSSYNEVDLTTATRRKFWIIEKFAVSGWITKTTPNLVSSIIPQIYRVDAKKLELNNQNLAFNEFLFFSSNAEDITLFNTVVRKANHTVLVLEEIVKHLPKIKMFKFDDTAVDSLITLNTVQELLKLPHFSKIDVFRLHNITETFDIDTLFAYVKKNVRTKFWLEYKASVDTYQNRLEAIVDEILGTENHEYVVPFIYFWELEDEKWRSLHFLYNKH